ncbi:MAG: spore cortex biosynthesis protein YabQ [Clostridia bacterium]|nr:spore cortex biosynthesis protein YabQ [Clostridia bacterium]
MTPEWLWGVLLFSRSVLFGAGLGLYYEVFRFLRILFTHPTWLVAAEDLLFLLPASLAHIFFHYAFGEGETRWFAVLGVILGFLLYLASVGKIVQKALRGVRRMLKKRVWDPLRARLTARREKRAQKKQMSAEKRRHKKKNKNRLRHKNKKTTGPETERNI